MARMAITDNGWIRGVGGVLLSLLVLYLTLEVAAPLGLTPLGERPRTLFLDSQSPLNLFSLSPQPLQLRQDNRVLFETAGLSPLDHGIQQYHFDSPVLAQLHWHPRGGSRLWSGPSHALLSALLAGAVAALISLQLLIHGRHPRQWLMQGFWSLGLILFLVLPPPLAAPLLLLLGITRFPPAPGSGLPLACLVATLLAGALLLQTLWQPASHLMSWLPAVTLVPFLLWQMGRPANSTAERLLPLPLLLCAVELPLRPATPLPVALTLLLLWQYGQVLAPLLQRARGGDSQPVIPHPALDHLQTQIRSLTDKNRILREKSLVDPLTGLRNRQHFNEQYQAELQCSARNQMPLGLLMVDIDFFKQINDKYGHPAGDAVLQEVARRLYYSLRRPSDALCRFGGEEFVILLPNTNEQGAQHVAEVIRRAIHDRLFVMGEERLQLSISVGCASRVHINSEPKQKLLKLADEALYQAKLEGRNRVVCAQSSTLPVEP